MKNIKICCIIKIYSKRNKFKKNKKAKKKNKRKEKNDFNSKA